MMFKNTPIRQKLIGVILLTSAAVLLLSSAAFITYEVLTIRKGMIDGYCTRAEIIAANSTAALAFQNPGDAADVLNALRTDPRVIVAGIYDAHGKLFAKYPANAPDSSFPVHPDTTEYREKHLDIFVPIVQNNRALGTVYVKTNLSALTDRYEAYFIVTFIIFVISILIAYFISRLLQEQISKPILALSRTAETISEKKDYSVRAPKYSGDELGLLTDTFNQMLIEIESQQEQSKRYTQGLELSNKEMQDFVFVASHDLQEPLRKIQTFGEFLGTEYSKSLDQAGRDYVERMRDAAKRMQRLINDLLSLTRVTTLAKPFSLLELKNVIRLVESDLEIRIQETKAKIEVGPLPAIEADTTQMYQLFQNLISNALKFHKPGQPAEISVTAELLNNNQCRIQVKDKGIGFDNKYSEHIFKVFERLHGREEYEGTGIGLAVCRKVVERHGGTITAESTLGQGSVFTITLPLKQKK